MKEYSRLLFHAVKTLIGNASSVESWDFLSVGMLCMGVKIAERVFGKRDRTFEQ